MSKKHTKLLSEIALLGNTKGYFCDIAQEMTPLRNEKAYQRFITFLRKNGYISGDELFTLGF